MPVTTYDVSTDETRDITQRDVALMTAAANAYGRLREQVAKIHAELQAQVAEINQRFPAMTQPQRVENDRVTGDL